MNSLELKKLQVEYKRVNAAREEQELRVLELEAQIAKTEESIKVSIEAEDKLLARIAQIKSEAKP